MPYSVNDERQIVGWCEDEHGKCCPCLWTNTHPELFEDRGFGGVALQINNEGTIVGEVGLSRSGNIAVARWHLGNLQLFEPPAPYYTARAFRINNHGLAVGYLMQDGKPSDFFVWPLAGTPTIVGRGEAYGVNDEGWVAGQDGDKGAFLFRENKFIWLDDIVDTSWKIMWPFRLINDLRMVGVGKRHSIDRAVLLVPRYLTP